MSTFEDVINQQGHLVYTNVGNSMMPLLRQGRDLMIIGRKPEGRLKRYDIPLYKRDNGQYILHRILKTRKDDYVICGDNQWHREIGISDRHIIGVLQAVVRNGKQIPVTDWRFRLYSHVWCDFFWIRASLFWLRDLPMRLKSKLRQSSLPQMNSSERTLFYQVIQEGLWGKPVSSVPEGIRWNVVMDQFKYQTVMGIASEPMLRLVKEGMVPQSCSLEFLQRIGRNIQQHHNLDARVVEVFAMLQQQGFKPVLLKGQGNARFYPTPLLRQCGDIDIYIGPKDYRRAQVYFAPFGDGEKASESSKHYHINYKGVIVELHRIAEKQFVWGTNAEYQLLSKKWLEDTEPDYVTINGVQTPIPPLQFNALYVFNHLWHHFVLLGVGWRQVCDWAVLLHHAHNRIDKKMLGDQLQRLRLLHPWQCMGWLAVNRLGLPAEEMPFYSDKVAPKARRIERLMEQEGNFGKYQKGMSSGKWSKWIRKPISFLRHIIRFTHLIPISFIDTICGFSHTVIDGIIHYFTDKD